MPAHSHGKKFSVLSDLLGGPRIHQTTHQVESITTGAWLQGAKIDVEDVCSVLVWKISSVLNPTPSWDSISVLFSIPFLHGIQLEFCF